MSTISFEVPYRKVQIHNIKHFGLRVISCNAHGPEEVTWWTGHWIPRSRSGARPARSTSTMADPRRSENADGLDTVGQGGEDGEDGERGKPAFDTFWPSFIRISRSFVSTLLANLFHLKLRMFLLGLWGKPEWFWRWFLYWKWICSALFNFYSMSFV